MVIAIDGNEANIENRVGVNKYAYEIINAIYKLLPYNPDLIVYTYLKDKPCDDMPKETSNFKYKILLGGKVWIMTKLWPYLLSTKDKPNVFFAPNHYLPPFLTIPSVCSIMDLGFFESSAQFTKYDFWQLKYWTAWSLKRSKYILTISNATKQDIVRRYPSTESKIVVTYPGHDNYLTTKRISDTSIGAVKKKYHIVNNYLIYVGTLKPSKNIESLIEAFSKLNNSNLQLVIAGKKGWLYEGKVKSVAHCVRSHRNNDVRPATPEAKIVAAADSASHMTGEAYLIYAGRNDMGGSLAKLERDYRDIGLVPGLQENLTPLYKAWKHLLSVYPRFN